MKNLFIALAVTGLLVACSSSDSGSGQVSSAADNNNGGASDGVTEISFATVVQQPLVIPVDVGTVDVTIETNVAVTQAASVDLNYTGSATLGVDYTGPDSVTLFSGESQVIITLNINENSIGRDENIVITLANPDQVALADSNTQFAIITEPLSDLPEITFPSASNEPMYVSEKTGAIRIPVEASSLFEINGSVNLEYSGIAIRGTDYTAPDSIVFQAGEKQSELLLEIIDDLVPEGGENITIRMTNPENAVLGVNRELSVIISGQIVLPDTGVTLFYDSGDFTAAAPGGGYPGQDADYGYDTLNSNQSFDGHASFSYTKLDSAGNQLPENAVSYHCIRANNTGLVWERKTPPVNIDIMELPDTAADVLPSDGDDILDELGRGGENWIDLSPAEKQTALNNYHNLFVEDVAAWTDNWQSISYTYLWWLDDEAKNGGMIGATGGPFRDPANPVKPNCAFLDSRASAYVAPGNFGCSVKTYLEIKNRVGHCGYSDWRMPKINELQSLVIYQEGESSFDNSYFSSPGGGIYMSATTVADQRNSAWCVNESTAETMMCSKHAHYHFRAVRSSSE